jgi:hypothetical protein
MRGPGSSLFRRNTTGGARFREPYRARCAQILIDCRRDDSSACQEWLTNPNGAKLRRILDV